MVTLALIRIVHIGACVMAFGLLAFELFVAPRDQVLGRCRGACRTAIVVALVTWLAWLGQLASQMSGLPYDQALRPDVLVTVLTQTTFGQVWSIRLGLLIASALVALRLHTAVSSRNAFFLVGTTFCGITLGSLAWTGHALGAHPEHAFIDAAHVLAAGLWLGMLLPLLATVAGALKSSQPETHAMAASAARRFTLPGSLAVVTLASSGALNAWWLVGSFSALLATSYGLLVTGKIVLFTGMLVLASTNRWVLVPRVHAQIQSAPGAPRALRWLLASVAVELTLGTAVLALVGVLGITPPAAHEHTGHPMHHTM